MSSNPLRARAEAQARAVRDEDLAALTPAAVGALVHELRVHQLELEMQNEELRGAQVALDAERARYFDLYDLAPVGYLTLSEAGLILEANLRAATLLDTARRALVGQRWTHFILPADQDLYYRHRRQLFETGAPQTCELRLARLDANAPVTWMRLEATLAHDEVHGGRVCRAVMSDISVTKAAEAAQQRLEAEYRTLAENSPDLIARFDRDLRHVYVNPAAALAGRLAAPDYIGKTIPETLVPELDAVKWEGRLRQVFATGQMLELEDAFPTPQGLRTFHTKLVPEQGPDGAVRTVLSVARDITARRQAEEALRASEVHLARAQEVGHIGSWDWDILHAALTWSDELYRIWGIGRDFHLSFETIEALIHPEDRPHNAQMLQQLFAGRDAGAYEFRIIRPDGQVRSIYQSVAVARDAAGQAERMFGIMQDITERKHAEAEIQQLNAELEQRVEHRTQELRTTQEQLVRHERLAVLGQVAGGVSHELRNPLAVINNAVYYLKLTQPDASLKVKEYLTVIERECGRASGIIGDLLDFARDRLVDREVVEVRELVDDVLARFPPPEDVRVTLELPADLPAICADWRQSAQVLGNLVINACQAMPRGGELVIKGQETGGGDRPAAVGGHYVALSVRDTGTGILPENMSHLFEPLFTTKARGIGLGLAVSKKLVEANDGRIEVTSEVGMGSTFIIYLPAAAARPDGGK